MADEADRGQASGEIQKPGGDRKTIIVQAADNDAATLPELGITRQRLADWRTVRDAGEAVVERAGPPQRGRAACRTRSSRSSAPSQTA